MSTAIGKDSNRVGGKFLSLISGAYPVLILVFHLVFLWRVVGIDGSFSWGLSWVLLRVWYRTSLWIVLEV